MVLAAVFRVGKKNFSIERTGESWPICEKGRTVVRITVSKESMGWLKQKISLLSKSNVEKGFYISNSASSEDLVLNVKENVAGKFVAILCRSRVSRERPRSIYCPQGRNSSCWKGLAKALDEACGLQYRVINLRRNPTPLLPQSNVLTNKVDKIDTGPVNLGRIDDLRKNGIIVEASSTDVVWPNVEGLFVDILKVRPFDLFVISKLKALCEFHCQEDAETVLSSSGMSVGKAILATSRWSVGCETISPNAFLVETRWVLFGPPSRESTSHNP